MLLIPIFQLNIYTPILSLGVISISQNRVQFCIPQVNVQCVGAREIMKTLRYQ